ncbi:MAG: hypothetical protein KF851_04145 [Pirellulaceae bacterium]|nr:hypothetical protein [Pirellulaceae bacterium]
MLHRITKHFRPGDWHDMEFGFNQPLQILIRNPAGAMVRIRALWITWEEKKLDGSTLQKIAWKFGWAQIKVPSECDVVYYYGTDGPPGDIINIDF